MADFVINVDISEENYTVSLATASATNTADSISTTTHNTMTATTVQGALEQLADQFYRQASAPDNANLAEGDLWYDTSNELLKVYREVSSGSYEWQGLATAGGDSPTAFTLDGGSF